VTSTPGDDDGAEEITFVGPVAAAARMEKLTSRPGMAARVAEVTATGRLPRSGSTRVEGAAVSVGAGTLGTCARPTN